MGPIKDDLAKLNAHVTGIQTVTVNSAGENKTNVASTTTSPRTDPIPANQPNDSIWVSEKQANISVNAAFWKN